MSAMKDIFYEITEISEETGYDVDFLCERVTDYFNDCGDYNKALREVRDISLEYDW